MSATIPDDASASVLTKWKWAGIIVTVGWVLIGGAIGLLNIDCWGFDCVYRADLQTIGNYLAGIFAPPAFAWLIFGYLLQSEELALQRQELRYQRDELKLQRGETERLANETQKQRTAIELQARNQALDTFTRFRDFILSDLNHVSAAILAAAFHAGNGGTPMFSDTWISISAGDHYAMYERVLRFLDGDQRVFLGLQNAVQNRELNVRRIVAEYIAMYGKLLDLALSADGSGMIRRHYETNPAGRLYSILANMLGADFTERVRAFEGNEAQFQKEFLS